jgi:Bacterial Ig-like domain (group 2)/Calcineurin-like phosphoesterase
VRSARRLWLATALVSALGVGSCLGDPNDTLPSAAEAKLLLRADLSATAVATLVVEVTAPDITQALLFNIGIVAGAAAGTITIPAGSDRTITIRAYDAGGVQTHSGLLTVDVQPGTNPSIALVLTPLTGDAPIDVTLGSFTVTVTPAADSLLVGDTITLTATILDAGGTPVAGQVVWGILDPRVASVVSTGTQTGRVTAIRPGQTTVVATYGGTAGPAVVAVLGAPVVFVGAGDIASCGGSNRAEGTAQLLDAIAGTVFTLGDNAYPSGTADEFANCYHPKWGRHKARTRPSPGNHDYDQPGAGPYYAYFGASAGDSGKGYFSFDLGEWHIISLNSNISMSAGSPQEQWLRADLAASTKQCTLAYWHHSRFSSSATHGSSTAPRPLWQALYAAEADIVLTAHDHLYERFAPQTPDGVADAARGIRAFVVGTGGASLYTFTAPVANSEVRNSITWGVLKLTLSAAAYSWEFVPIAGQTFTDSGSGTCH